MAGGLAAGLFQGLSMVVSGIGQSMGYQHEAQKADRAAEISKIQADQIHAVYTADLNTTVANVRAIRAATGADPDSPSSLAYTEDQAKEFERARRIKVGGARMQAKQYQDDARYFRSAAGFSLFSGFLGAVPAFAGL